MSTNVAICLPTGGRRRKRYERGGRKKPGNRRAARRDEVRAQTLDRQMGERQGAGEHAHGQEAKQQAQGLAGHGGFLTEGRFVEASKLPGMER